MNSNVLKGLALGLVILVGYLVYENSESPVKPDQAPARRTVKLLLLTQSDCAPCDAIKRDFAPGFGLPCETLTLDATLQDRWKIVGTPTLIGLDQAGNETGRLLGYEGKEKTLAWLESLP